MTTTEFFENQSNNWNRLVDNSIHPSNMSAKKVNGTLLVCGEVKLVSATPARASHFIHDHQVFCIDCATTTSDDETIGLDVMDEIFDAFANRVPIEFDLRVFDASGYSNVYKTEVAAFETDDSTEEDSLDPKQSILVVKDNWEVVSTNKPCEAKAPVESKSAEVAKKSPTDFDCFTDYLRSIREKAYKESMENGDGSYSTSFTQTTNANGETVVTHSINGGADETYTFDKDGNIIDSKCDHKSCRCHGCK